MFELIRESANYYTGAFKKYTVFSGRSGRAEFWYFTLLNLFFIWLISIIIDELTNLSLGASMALVLVCVLAVLSPSVSVLVRRLHDINYNGLWSLIVFIPVIGWVALFILLIIPSNNIENQYGPSLKL